MRSPDTLETRTSYSHYLQVPLLVLATVLSLFGAPVQVQAQEPGGLGDGLLWADGIEPGEADDCEAPAGNKCLWVDCDAVSDGVGTHASPYWGFEEAVGRWDGVSYTIGSNTIASGDVLYVKGTCRASDHVNAGGGPYKYIHILRESQHGTPERPTIIKSWRGTAQAVFDGEDTATALIASQISAAKSKENALHFQNLKITRAREFGLSCGYFTGGGGDSGQCTVLSVDFEDNVINQGGVASPLTINAESSYANFHSWVRNCRFVDNDRNCEANGGPAGDTDCTVSNNDAVIDIYGNAATLTTTTMEISNNYFQNNTRHIRNKHSNSGLMRVFRNMFIDSDGPVWHIRSPEWFAYQNVVTQSSAADLTSGEDGGKPGGGNRDIRLYHNTFHNISRLASSNGATDHEVDWTVYNNIIDSPTPTSTQIRLAANTGNYLPLANWTSYNNMWRISATTTSTFSCIGPTSPGGACTNRSFADTMTYLSDSTSTADDAELVNVGTGDFRLSPTSPARTASDIGGYIGAIGGDFGCGRDTNRDGLVQALCPGSDRDGDGFTTAQGDCDDEDWGIFPGASVSEGCAAGQWRTCKVDGSGWTGCSSDVFCPNTADTNPWADLDPVTSCKYIATTGSNSTGDGSAGTPWASLSEISWGYSGGTSPVAGTAYIVRGGTYTETYLANSAQRHMYLRNVNCSASAPCHVMCYPGETCTFDFSASTPDQRVVTVEGSQYWQFEGFTTGIDVGSFILTQSGIGASRVRARRNLLDGVRGTGANNIAALNCDQLGVCDFDHNHIKTVCDTGETDCTNENICGIVMWRGSPNRARYNIVDPEGPTAQGCGIKVPKHAVYSAEYEVYGNYIRNTVYGLNSGGRNLTIKNNLVVSEQNRCFRYQNQGGESHIGDAFIAYNTCVDGDFTIDPTRTYNQNGSTAADNCSGDSYGPVDVERNIITSTKASMTQDTRMVRIHTYGPKPLRDTFIVGGLIGFADNCYYSSTSLTSLFGDFEASNADTSCSGRADGSSLTLAGWQSLGVDTGGVVANPGLDLDTYLPSTNCTSHGYRYNWPTIGTDPDPTPTPTPTPSPTPTLVPTVGLPYIMPVETGAS